MEKQSENHNVELTQPPVTDVPYGSHLIRLSLKEWLIAAVFLLAIYFGLPALWNQFEPLKIGPDYRIPYALSNDYWIFQRYVHSLREQEDLFVLGDSVIWGEYVTPDQTLSHCLSKKEKESQFANVGINGIHPVALAGLVEYYGQSISRQPVILHCNPLWMSSPRHDLQSEKEFSFNHPRLVSQFYPNIPCYRASFSERASIVAERVFPFLLWVRHLQIAYFNNLDIPSWTIEHPYANPLEQIEETEFLPEDDLRHGHGSWEERGIQKQDFPWVELTSSFQWRYFQNTLQTLIRRDNRVFVVVGPFNEHMMTEESLRLYQTVKSGIKDWLESTNSNYWIPDVLPSEYYADASHPTQEGYALLAEKLYENSFFNEWKREL